VGHDAVLLRQGPHFEQGLAHEDAQRLRFGRAGHDAAVVVAEHHHGLAFEARLKGALAADVKIIAVDEREHLRGACR
jgi:hypothetical protein